VSYHVVQQTLIWEKAERGYRAVLKEGVVATCDALSSAVQAAASLAKTRKTGAKIPTACFMVRKKEGYHIEPDADVQISDDEVKP
jgi:hypothetical protein